MGTGGRRIRLAAIFEPGKAVRPVWFELDRRKHTLQEPSYRWQDRVGEATVDDVRPRHSPIDRAQARLHLGHHSALE